MRTLLLFSIAIMLTAVSCKKDDCTEWQTVDVTGSYVNTPDPTGGFNQVTLPDGTVLQTPKKYKVSGSDNVIGTLNATQSVLEVTSIGLNFKTGAFDLVLHIILYNTAGETIVMDGTAQFYADNTGLSWMHYTSGTGKFNGITGWMTNSITSNPTTGVHTVAATGEATYKK